MPPSVPTSVPMRDRSATISVSLISHRLSIVKTSPSLVGLTTASAYRKDFNLTP
ncbi:MAG: hypothetical protein ACI4RU_01300 [Acutalibacteraceae bacterium]